MLRIVARLRASGRGRCRSRSPLTSVIPAALHGHVGAGAHRDADVRLRQRGGVVDPVAGHRDHAPLRLQPLDDLALPLRQTSASTSSMPDSARDGLRGGAAVAGEHDDAHAVACERADRVRASMALIGSATPSSPAALPSTATNTTVCPSARSASARRASVAGLESRSRRAASRCRARPGFPSTTAGDPLARAGSGTRDAPASVHAALPRRPPRWPRPADARWPLLQARGQREQFVLADAGRWADRGKARLALGERAGLVHHQRVDLLEHLERLGVPDQHARARAPADAHHDRHRRGQAQRARAGDDQHRDGVDERVGQPRLRAPAAPTPRTSRRRRRRRPARTQPRRGRRRAGSARGCAAPRETMRTICASSVSPPTRSARITKLPVAVDRAAR